MIVKTYLSRAQSRAWSLEHPMGDPTGGPAYREMRAPAVAAIGMATSFSGMMAGSIMAGVAFAGSALSLVGSLTGNKTLARIGMVAGAIGGAGMAGVFGETIQGATWGSAFGGGEAAAGGSMAAQSLSQSAAPAAGNLAPVVDGAQAFPVSTPVDVAPTALGPIGSGGIVPGALNAPGAAGLNALGAAPAPGIGGGIPGPLSQTSASTAPGTSAAEGIAPTQSSGGLIDGAVSAGKGFTSFIKDNPELAKVLASGAGGLAEYLSGVPDAQLDALQAQAGYADARAMQIQEEIELEKQRRANLNAGYQQVNQNINVNPDANMLQYQPVGVRGGLIAGAQR